MTVPVQIKEAGVDGGMGSMRLSSALQSIIFVTLLGYLGTALPYPIFAPLFINSSAEIARSDLLSPIWLFSLLMAIYPAGTLVGGICLGQCSDRYGRKLVILWSLAGAVLTNLLAAYAIYAQNYALLFGARFVTGFCEGNISVARAMLVDLDLGADKAVAFGYLGSAGYAGYLAGPLIGAYLSVVSFSAPFVLAAGLCVAATTVCARYLPSGQVVQTKVPHSGENEPFWRRPGLLALLAVQLIITMAINIYHEFFPVLMVQQWDATPQQISFGTIVATTTMIVVSVFGIRLLLVRWSLGGLYASSMLMLGVSLALFAVPRELLLVYPVFVLLGLSLAIFNSSSNTWISNRFAMVRQGKLMGVVGSMFFFSNIAAALAGGVVANISVTLLMVLGGVLAVVAAALLKFVVARRVSDVQGV